MIGFKAHAKLLRALLQYSKCRKVFQVLFEETLAGRYLLLSEVAHSLNVGFNGVYFLTFYSFHFLVVVYLAPWCFISLSKWYPSLTGSCLCCVHVCNHVNTPCCQRFRIVPVTHSASGSNPKLKMQFVSTITALRVISFMI